jgi:Sigma-70, region 4
VKQHEIGAETNELRSLVDEELERLPERYRATLVLCELEGRTHEQAAALLCCPVGTVKSRLARGRQRLRDRLARRGLAMTGLTDAALLATETAPAILAELLNGTIKKAVQLRLGCAASTAMVSGQTVRLMKGAIRSMVYSRLKIAAIAGFAAVSAVVTAVPAFVSRVPGAPAAMAQGPVKVKTSAKPASAVDQPVPERGCERYQRDNGLTVVLRPVVGATRTDLIVVYSIGGDHEPDGQSGLSHLVEHVYFTAAAGDLRARTFDEVMQRYPSGGNGQTGDRYTVFSVVSFPQNDLDSEIREAAARMGSLRITGEDLGRERPRLLAEASFMFDGLPCSVR